MLMFGSCLLIACRMCAYSLTNRKYPTLHDCVEDGEHGGGRAILKVLEDRDLRNKAIFVIRNYGKVKLFDMRFQLIEKVTTDALSRSKPMQGQRKQNIIIQYMLVTSGSIWPIIMPEYNYSVCACNLWEDLAIIMPEYNYSVCAGDLCRTVFPLQ